MKVILCENVPNLGEMGETVDVADGYARNFLIPRKLAVRTDTASARQIEHERRILQRKEEKMRAELSKEAKALDSVTVEVTARAGEEDRIFGSITTANIAEKLLEAGHQVDKRHIMLEEPIKALGIFSVPIRLARGIEANVKVWVKSDAEETAEAEPVPATEE